MSPVDWSQVAEIYADALELPVDRRLGFVKARCAGQPELLAEVGRMLAAGDEAHASFLTSVDPNVLHEIADEATTARRSWTLDARPTPNPYFARQSTSWRLATAWTTPASMSCEFR